MLNRRLKEGDLYVITLGEGLEALCRVLYKSSYFKNVVLIGCYGVQSDTFNTENAPLIAHHIYIGMSNEILKTWRFISTRQLSVEEQNISRRIVADDIWIGDNCLGKASLSEIADYPKMDVYGKNLFLKKIHQQCCA